MQAGSKEARRYALGLLLAGLSPEQAEARLEGRLVQREAHTALTDPTNVMMKEVGTMAQPRGAIDIKGVTTRHNQSDARHCVGNAHGLFSGIGADEPYERVMLLDGTVESYHPDCFAAKFGARGLYGA